MAQYKNYKAPINGYSAQDSSGDAGRSLLAVGVFAWLLGPPHRSAAFQKYSIIWVSAVAWLMSSTVLRRRLGSLLKT
jgi:hypothetical protein